VTTPKSETGPTVIPQAKTVWTASQPVVEVPAGGWVTFDSQGRPARLWFPKEGQMQGDSPVDLEKGPVSFQTNPNLDVGTKIPYVFFLTEVEDKGDWLEGSSPPYIIIKDPDGRPGGTDGGN
jgi:hypothetical protein